LLRLGVVPIINENDTVVTDEIKFGDNDTLGALVANLIEADALIILTDQQGLYSADPRKDPNAVLIQQGAPAIRRWRRWPAAPAAAWAAAAC
jgi:glutamate 5-kinase